MTTVYKSILASMQTSKTIQRHMNALTKYHDLAASDTQLQRYIVEAGKRLNYLNTLNNSNPNKLVAKANRATPHVLDAAFDPTDSSISNLISYCNSQPGES